MRGEGIVDCDVHQDLAEPESDLFEYLSHGWQEFVLARAGRPDDGARNSVVPGNPMFAFNPFGYTRKDAVPPSGRGPGTSPEFMVEQLLDRHNVVAAVLTGGVGLDVSGLTNPYFAAEVARAHNDHMLDHWLSADKRFKGSLQLALQVPEWAATEIMRHHKHGQVIQAIAGPNPHAYPFGHPIFDSVHKACAETGLPFAIHAFGDGSAGAVGAALASGRPTLYLEFHLGAFQGLVTHLTSFIFHGVFDRYPTLRVVLVEPTVGWIPAFLKRMDADFRGVRREVPWCRRLPSEYFHDNVAVTTQPFDVDSSDDPVITALDAVGAEDFLMFSSDYPHWDADVPSRVAALVPKRWRSKIMRENASRLYGLDLPL